MISKIIISVLIGVTITPALGLATLRSDSYVIQETVSQSFDGPVISGAAASAADTTATVSWTTDVVADSIVVYDTNASFSASKEQGEAAKTSASHSVTVTGLSANTTYYFKVKSTSLNNGTSESQASTFTTSAAASSATVTSGGFLIIDKGDKTAPMIIDIKTASSSAGAANKKIGFNLEVSAKIKRYFFEFFRHAGKPKLFAPAFFAAGIIKILEKNNLTSKNPLTNLINESFANALRTVTPRVYEDSQSTRHSIYKDSILKKFVTVWRLDQSKIP